MGRPAHPNELSKHETLLPTFAREITFHRGEWGDDGPAGEPVTLAPSKPALSTIHNDTMYAAALAGMGISGLPSYVVEDALLEHALERVLPEWRVLTLRIYAAMPTRKYVPARTRAFMDFLVQTFGGEERDPWLLAAGCATARSIAPCEQATLQ
jgi:DNA-binding transcriptional LysR family regulator